MESSESKRFSKKKEDFTCEVCGTNVKGTGFTDHCPECLWSKHVDINPGDRKSECDGLMKPIRTIHNRNSFLIEYRCKKCGFNKKVQAAPNDNSESLFKLLETS